MTGFQAHHITVTFDDKVVVDQVSAGVTSGEIVGLIGPNGAGKTTLLRVLASLLTPDTGDVTIDDTSLLEISAKERARAVAYLPQGQNVEWPLSVMRLVALGRLPHLNPWSNMQPQDLAAIEEAIHAADIDHLRDRTITTLSGGERARALLARAVAGQPDYLLIDEPTASLDPGHQLAVMKLLRDRAHAGVGVITVLHDLTLAARFCDRLVLMDQGKVVADAAPETVLTDENLAEVYGITAIRGTSDDGFYIVPGHEI